jgi:hypothetical protein
MNDIAGIPYREAKFDKKGKLENSVDLPDGVTDLFVMSHGWNNDDDAARTMYRNFFESFSRVGQPGDLQGRSLAIIGVIWPSKKFDELVAVAGTPEAQGAASLGAADKSSQKSLEEKIERMKETFQEPGQDQLLNEIKALIPELEEKGSARREFVEKIRRLLDPGAANQEDASVAFFKDDANEVMNNLKVDEDDLDEEVSSPGGAMMFGGTAAVAQGGAVGLKQILSGFKSAAMNVLNFTTYYEMKARAGAVGKNGVAKLIDGLAPRVQRIHLIGHSFGGRVVAATASNSTNDKIASMTLLQAAFSHNGFSKSMKGFFRDTVERSRVRGPILVTHTKNDKAVGVAYPIASRLSGERAAAFGDEKDVFGGIGRNGAQQMEKDEAIFVKLLPENSAYAFQTGKFFNLEGSDFIKDHSDVTGGAIASAVRRAVAG